MKYVRYFFRQIERGPAFIAFGVIFRIALELAYTDFVSPTFEYAGFLLVDSPEKYFESWTLYVGILLFLPVKTRKPSDFLICLAFFAYIAPLLVFYGLAGAERWVLYCVLLQFVIVEVVRRGRPIGVPVVRNGPRLALGVSIAGIVAATAWILASAGLANFNLDLFAVYDFREEANITIYQGWLGYVVEWATTVCGPFILMLALRDRRLVLALAVCLLHVFWFGLTSHKSVLFYPALVAFSYSIFRYSRATSLIPVGMCFVVLTSLIAYYATESALLSSLFVRRVFFVPSHLTFTYYEFFDQESFVFWSNSFLSWLIAYPYDESVALVIGNYLNDPTLWANNSFFSTGYMHAGLFGIAIYGLTAGVLLKIIDSFGNKGLPLWMSLSVVIVPFFSLFTSSDLPTTLLTHGLGFGILVLYLMGRKAGEGALRPKGSPGWQSPTGGASTAAAASVKRAML